jgi:hypothetical protein
MLDNFAKLKEKTESLGNHHFKYLRLISSHGQQLIDVLESKGKIDAVQLWRGAQDICGQMAMVRELGETEQEKLEHLGCFFALQYLHMNTRAVDILRLGLSARADRFRVYRDFMQQMGNDLRQMVSCYMEQLLNIFLPEDQRPEFVICSVGTRADQDDLDLGIVDDGSELRSTFNRAVGRLQREMLRRAVPLHFYLSEHVGEQSFSASIAEYRQLLDREIQDFIIISEMLGAKPILGSHKLFNLFTKEVTDRYFYRPGGDNRFHEGYLRGMLGEVRALMMWDIGRRSVDPKSDALRIIKGIISARKTVFGLEEVNAWEVLRQLMELDSRYLDVYEEMEKSLSFIEAFRFLYQMLEVQEETIPLEEEGSHARLTSVAELMGYEDMGVVKAYDHLLIHYHEHVTMARSMAQVLVEDLRIHLERVSVFSGMVRTRGLVQVGSSREGNLAVEFVTALRFFRGTRFWDDVLDQLEGADVTLLKRFVDDFNLLGPSKKLIWIQRYAKWGEVTALPLFRLLDILYRNTRKVDSLYLFQDLGSAFIGRLMNCTDKVSRVTTVFHHYPRLVNSFLLGMPVSETIRFLRMLEGDQAWSEEVEVLRQRLIYFCRLHLTTSHYFKRFFQRIVVRYAEYVEHFDKPQRLKVIAKGIFARLDSLKTFSRKKHDLGSYYDLEFLRVGLEAMNGKPTEYTDAEFTEFSDNYFKILFDVCKQEVDQESGGRVPTRDLLGIYSAGGHGRKLAFDDDFDLVAILKHDEPEVLAYCCRIIARMNRQIIRRGTMPHYRFAERFGEYVTTFGQIQSLFDEPDETTFIDMSQLMSGRRIVGSKQFEIDLRQQIIDPYILARKDDYIRRLAREIRSRHEAVDQGLISKMNVKETKGGLRDIELLLLCLEAKHNLWQPVSLELHQPLLELMPHRAGDLGQLFQAFTYLKHRRDLYRLTVAAEDELLTDETGHLARILGYGDDPDSRSGSERMVFEYLATTARVERVVLSFLEELGY